MSLELDPRLRSGFAGLNLTLPSVEANLALDEALLVAAEDRDSGPWLRFWELPSFAVVLGASCRLDDDVNRDFCEADGVAIGRRSSGGGTVVIGPGALNVTVVLPADAAPGLAAVDRAQAFVLGRCALALLAAGVPAEVQGSGDLTLGDRKFAGSAQRRLKRHFLVHTSILYDFPLARIARYTRLPKRQPGYRGGRSHDDFVTNVPLPRSRLLSAVRTAWMPAEGERAGRTVPMDLVSDLVSTKFAAEGWVTRL